MRYCLILILQLSFLVINAQQKDSSLLVLTENSFDFGRLSSDKGSISHTFKFTNGGNIPLIITNVRSTCGCTIPKWTNEPVMPGKEGTIEVNFDAAGQPGSFHKTIQIMSTAYNANMFITISGTVVPALKKEELKYKIGQLSAKTNHLNFGYLFKGNTGIELLTVANNTSKPIHISFPKTPDHIRIMALPSILQPGEYGQIEVQYCTDRTNDWDVIIDKIPLILNNKNENSDLTITANIREDFSKYTPEQLQTAPKAIYENMVYKFDTLHTNKAVECRFKIKNEGYSDLIIRAVKPSCGCTAVVPEDYILAPGESTFIDALYKPEEQTGDFKTGITVITNDPTLYKQYLWLEGYIKK